MKRKFILFLMIAVLMIAVFAGCGDNNSDTVPETTNATQASTIETYFDIDEETEPTLPDVDNLTLTEYNNLSAEQQQAVMDTFDTLDEYFEWYNEKVQKHEDFVEQQLNPTESTENNETTETAAPFIDIPDHDVVTFMDYNAMSGDEQMAFINSFESIDAFLAWHSAAQQAYQDSLIEYDGSTPIDLDDYVGND